MLDEESDTIDVREGFARHLGLPRRTLAFDLDGDGEASYSYRSLRITVPIKTEGEKMISIEGLAVPPVTNLQL